MSNSHSLTTTAELAFKIEDFVNTSSGLKLHKLDDMFCVSQITDKKKIILVESNISDVLQREDVDKRKFLQINFISNQKILLTDNLIGFKPQHVMGLDLTKIPKVVTTPDLKSVYEAIEDSLSSDNSSDYELDVLKRVYLAILNGGESIGFELKQERAWYSRICSTKLIACA